MAAILAVDDSNSIRQMVSHTLQSAGHDVTSAIDGVDALEQAKQGTFDLVLTDVNMPNMNGISLIRHLRELTEFQYTPILVLTTESSAERKTEGRSAGATGWIVKPFNPAQLVDVVGKVLAR